MASNHGAVDPARPRPTERPSGVAVPVSVPLNLTLVRRPGLFIRATTAGVCPDGFLFLLSVGCDIRRIPFESVDFYAPRELGYPLPARLQARFPDGRVGDSLVKLPGSRLGEDAVLIYRGGTSHPIYGDREQDSFRRHETSWWVSPLPPPGPLEFAVHLRDSPELAGSGAIDTEPILEAAVRSETRWGAGGAKR
jgi:hypothetical protein